MRAHATAKIAAPSGALSQSRHAGGLMAPDANLHRYLDRGDGKPRRLALRRLVPAVAAGVASIAPAFAAPAVQR